MQRVGPFLLKNPLAKGGMGMVWHAHHESTNIPVALKVIIPSAGARSDGFMKLFRAEVRATARLNHPNVVEVLDYGTLPHTTQGQDLVGGAPYYVMTYAKSGSLEDCVPSNWDELLRVLRDVLRGLAHAHAHHVVHRDIKPANILCDRNSNGEPFFQLTDFGIAHAMDRETKTLGEGLTVSSQESASGTPRFMSPEQFLGSWREFGPWTDLYALGILAYTLACGTEPFKAKTLRELGMLHINAPIPQMKPRFPVPIAFEEWVGCMTEKAVRQRTQTAADAIAQLEAMDDGVEEAARLRAPVAASWRQFYSSKRKVLSGAGLGLFGLRHFPLTGRDAACDVLWDNLRLAGANQEVRVVLVHGPSGVGKSRLMDWFASTAAESGAAQVFREGPRSAERIGGGLGDLISPFFRTRGLSTAEVEVRVLEYLSEIGVVSMEMVRVLTGILDTSSESVQVPASQAAEVVDRLLRFLADDNRTVIAAMDDAQFNDAAVELIRQALKHPSQSENGLVYVLGITDQSASAEIQAWLDEIAAHPNTVSLHLNPLSTADIKRMIEAVVELPVEALNEVAKRSEGSPFLAVQLVNDWVERGILVAEDGQITMNAELPSIPASVFKLWMSRIERMLIQVAAEGQIAEDVRAQIELLATLGKATELVEIEAVFAHAGLPPADELLDLMARRHLVKRVLDRVQLEHGMLQDAILESAKERGTFESRHATCASALAKLYAPKHPGLALRLASHLIAAKSYGAGFIALEFATQHARRTYDISTVSSATKLWLGAMADANVHEDNPMWAAAYSLRAYSFLLATAPGSRQKAVECADKAVEIAAKSQDPDANLAAIARKALTTLYTGAWLDGAELLRTGITLYQGASDNVRAEAYITLARLSAVVRDLDEVLRVGHLALDCASDEALIMQAHQVIARALLESGNLEGAEAEIDRAIELCRQHRYFVAEARSYQTKAFIMDAGGDYVGAEAAHRSALSLFDLVAAGSSYPPKEREFLGRALLVQGKVEEALKEFTIVQDDFARGRIVFRQNLADGLLACAASLANWSAFDTYLEQATTFEFEPSNLNYRALGIAFGCARDVDEERATKLLERVMRLSPDEEDKGEFFGAANAIYR